MGTYIGSSDNIKNTLAVIEASWESAASVPFLIGSPGIGKTELVKSLGRKMDLPVYILLGSTMDPTDVAGLPALKTIRVTGADGSETEAIVTENTLAYWAEELIRTGKGILFFDELTTTTPAVQAALLTLLQGRMVGRHKIPDTVYFIAAANPADEAADGYDLAPPMANRLIHIDYKPDLNDWFEGMVLAWENEGVPAAELEERSRIVAFLKNNPTLANAMPGETAVQGGAWPSYRSWDNLSRVLARIPSGMRPARRIAMEGLVGDAAATQFTIFEDTLKLPDYDFVLASPERVDWKGLDGGSAYIVMQMLVSRMTLDTMSQTFKAFGVAAEKGEREDIGVSLAKPLIRRARDLSKGDKEREIEFRKAIAGPLRQFIPLLSELNIQ